MYGYIWSVVVVWCYAVLCSIVRCMVGDSDAAWNESGR